MPYADRPHKRGHPLRAESPTQQTSVRLTRAEREAVARHSRVRGKTRAELIREAMAAAGLFDPPQG